MNYDNAASAAGGGMTAPPQAVPEATASPMPTQMRGPEVGADEVPNLGDQSNRPSEPVTAGLPYGPGAGPEALGPMPPSPVDPVRQVVQAMMMVSPNPDLLRVLNRLNYEGR